MSEGVDLALAIVVSNIIIGVVVACWCNKKINEFTDPKRWKKFRKEEKK